jgi:NAD-dependent SIR2 family protein deacetylase
VQQNHDGLPQKAGFPQEKINEIHGSWYDPSNPVVKYSGTLHDKCYPWMEHDADTADLVLVLGTSLGGLNADQVATKASGFLHSKPRNLGRFWHSFENPHPVALHGYLTPSL